MRIQARGWIRLSRGRQSCATVSGFAGGMTLALTNGMKITQYVHRAVVTVKPSDSALHARELLERHRINQLPVVEEGHVVGIVTDRDLRDVFPSTLEYTRPKPPRHTVDPARA